jgi:hypothetical protein
MMKVANVLIARNGNKVMETVKFYQVTWAPTHVVFHQDKHDLNIFIAYNANDVIEIVAEENEDYTDDVNGSDWSPKIL